MGRYAAHGAEEAAAEVMKSCQIYRLYGDDTEGLVLDAKEIREHAVKGGNLRCGE